MQVSPATRLFSYLTEFAALRRAEPRLPIAADALQSANGTVAANGVRATAQAAPTAPGAAIAAAISSRAAQAEQAPTLPAAQAMPRLLPRGTLVNIIT